MFSQSITDIMKIGEINGFGVALLALVAVAFVAYAVWFFKNKDKKD